MPFGVGHRFILIGHAQVYRREAQLPKSNEKTLFHHCMTLVSFFLSFLFSWFRVMHLEFRGRREVLRIWGQRGCLLVWSLLWRCVVCFSCVMMFRWLLSTTTTTTTTTRRRRERVPMQPARVCWQCHRSTFYCCGVKAFSRCKEKRTVGGYARSGHKECRARNDRKNTHTHTQTIIISLGLLMLQLLLLLGGGVRKPQGFWTPDSSSKECRISKKKLPNPIFSLLLRACLRSLQSFHLVVTNGIAKRPTYCRRKIAFFLLFFVWTLVVIRQLDSVTRSLARSFVRSSNRVTFRRWCTAHGSLFHVDHSVCIVYTVQCHDMIHKNYSLQGLSSKSLSDNFGTPTRK